MGPFDMQHQAFKNCQTKCLILKALNFVLAVHAGCTRVRSPVQFCECMELDVFASHTIRQQKEAC